MRKKHKNELFQILVNSKYGIDKFDFEESIDETIGYPTVKISFKNSPFYFKIRVSNNDFNAVMEKIYKTASKRALELFNHQSLKETLHPSSQAMNNRE